MLQQLRQGAAEAYSRYPHLLYPATLILAVILVKVIVS